MLELITSPAGTALAVVFTLVLGYFAIRGIGRREEPEPEHLYIRLKRAKKKAAGRAGTRTDGKG